MFEILEFEILGSCSIRIFLLSWYLELWFCTALLSYSQVCLLLHYMILDLFGVVDVFVSVVVRGVQPPNNR